MPASIASTVARLLALAVAVVLAGCSAPPTGAVEWRDLDLVVPDGWLVLESRQDLLYMANEDLSLLTADTIGAGRAPDTYDVVAAQLTTDTSSSPDEWRGLIASEGGTIESDQQLSVGGVPATSIQFRWVTNGVDTRERVVLIASRDLTILMQPVPVQGQTTAPDVYDAHVEEFEALLSSIVFGAPTDF